MTRGCAQLLSEFGGLKWGGQMVFTASFPPLKMRG